MRCKEWSPEGGSGCPFESETAPRDGLALALHRTYPSQIRATTREYPCEVADCRRVGHLRGDDICEKTHNVDVQCVDKLDTGASYSLPVFGLCVVSMKVSVSEAED